MLNDKNVVNIFYEYSLNIGIGDEIEVLLNLKNSIEDYFGEPIYFDEESHVRFVKNDKKITFSEKLSIYVIKNLKKLKKEYLLQNRLDPYVFLNKFVKAKVIKETKNGYFLVDKHDNNCFLAKKREYTFKTGYEDFFFCQKVKNNILQLSFDKSVAEHTINELLGPNTFAIYVEKWFVGKLLVISFQGNKFGNENVKRLRWYFKDEKIIYKKR